MVLKDTKGVFDTRKSGHTWTVPTVFSFFSCIECRGEGCQLEDILLHPPHHECARSNKQQASKHFPNPFC